MWGITQGCGAHFRVLAAHRARDDHSADSEGSICSGVDGHASHSSLLSWQTF